MWATLLYCARLFIVRFLFLHMQAFFVQDAVQVSKPIKSHKPGPNNVANCKPGV